MQDDNPYQPPAAPVITEPLSKRSLSLPKSFAICLGISAAYQTLGFWATEIAWQTLPHSKAQLVACAGVLPIGITQWMLMESGLDVKGTSIDTYTVSWIWLGGVMWVAFLLLQSRKAQLANRQQPSHSIEKSIDEQ